MCFVHTMASLSSGVVQSAEPFYFPLSRGVSTVFVGGVWHHLSILTASSGESSASEVPTSPVPALWVTEEMGFHDLSFI